MGERTARDDEKIRVSDVWGVQCQVPVRTDSSGAATV